MASFLFGWLDLSWDILGYSKQSEDLISCFLEIFKVRKFGMGFFGVFDEIPRIFFKVLIYAAIRSSSSLETGLSLRFQVAG